ncbi:hypothetical protein VCHC56A2_3640, partial [Vibrio cholerae HC-56A2]
MSPDHPWQAIRRSMA